MSSENVIEIGIRLMTTLQEINIEIVIIAEIH